MSQEKLVRLEEVTALPRDWCDPAEDAEWEAYLQETAPSENVTGQNESKKTKIPHPG